VNPYEQLPADAWAAPTPAPPPAPEAPEPPAPVFANVGVFVDELLRPTYMRFVGSARLWCPHWFRHAEAVTRLHKLWRAFEHLARAEEEGDGTAGAVWIRDFLDPCLDRIMDPEGPFQFCKDGHAEEHKPLPGAAWEPGLFDNL
jgi:hypothetical protein